jgi:hypothetical protein
MTDDKRQMTNLRALLLCDDLLFGSNIQGHARHHGIDLRQARTAPALIQVAQEQPATLAILDLQLVPFPAHDFRVS